MVGMVTMPTASTLLTALPEIMPNSAEPTTAILAAPPRKRPMADIEISAKKSAPPVRAEDLAENREGDHDHDRDLQNRSDRTVDVEAEIDDHTLRRDVAGLEIAGQMRADVDVDRHCRDHADEAPAVGAAACLHDQQQISRALTINPLERNERDLIGERRHNERRYSRKGQATTRRPPSRSSDAAVKYRR